MTDHEGLVEAVAVAQDDLDEAVKMAANLGVLSMEQRLRFAEVSAQIVQARALVDCIELLEKVAKPVHKIVVDGAQVHPQIVQPPQPICPLCSRTRGDTGPIASACGHTFHMMDMGAV